MSLPIDVRAYSGYRANERPISFFLDDDVIDIAEVEDRWHDQHAEYFKVLSTEHYASIAYVARVKLPDGKVVTAD